MNPEKRRARAKRKAKANRLERPQTAAIGDAGMNSSCDCIKTPGGIRGFGAWCKEHRKLLEDYEFQRAKADQVVTMYEQLQAEKERLRAELEDAHQIIKDDVATQEALRLRMALAMIAQGVYPGRDVSLFAEQTIAMPAVHSHRTDRSMCRYSTTWSMPNRWTFEQPPVADFLRRWLDGCKIVVDPFAGRSTIGTLSNDLGEGGVDAEEFCTDLLLTHAAKCDAVLFDPPYSPRQISECYKSVGRKVTTADTQNAALYARVRKPLAALLRPGGIALSFGWQSSGFGNKWATEEVMLVQHGGAHNDTICVAQRKAA